MQVTASGRTGEVRIGGRVAAELGPWEAERDAEGWYGSAAITLSNDVLLAHAGPFELRLNVGQRVWRWRSVEIEGEDALTFRATGERDIIEGA